MRKYFNQHSKTLSVLLIGSSVGAAFAQSSVSIYGTLDTGVEYLNRVEGRGSMTRVPATTGGQEPSRLGFRGTEDLGGGLSAVFALEGGLSVSDGSQMQSGRAYGRHAYVGLRGSWGELTFGRQQAMGLNSLIGTDVMGPSVYSQATFNTYIPNQRMDSSVAYRGTFGDWAVGLLYSNAQDGLPPINCGRAQSSSGCEASSASLKYDNKRWGATIAYNRLSGIEGSGFFGQPGDLTYDNQSRDMHSFLTGYMLVGSTRLSAGLIHRKLKSVFEDYRTDQYYLGVKQPIGDAFVVDASYIGLNAKREQSNAKLIAVRGSYNFSRRSALYLSTGYVRNDAQVGYSASAGSFVPASPGLGRSQLGTMLGFRHSF